MPPRPPPDARQERLARRHLPHTLQGRLARKSSLEALQVRLARKSSPDALQGRVARMAPPDDRKLAGVGRVFAGEEIRLTLASSPQILRFPTLTALSSIENQRFLRFSKASGNKWANEEICPTLASLRASGRNLPGRKSARRPKSTGMVSNLGLPNFQLLVEPNVRRESSPTTTMPIHTYAHKHFNP